MLSLYWNWNGKPPKGFKQTSDIPDVIKASLWASLVAQMVKNLPAVWETQVQFLGWKKPMEKGMATHSSILAWRIPQTEEPDGLQTMGLQRGRQDWATNTPNTHTHTKHRSSCNDNRWEGKSVSGWATEEATDLTQARGRIVERRKKTKGRLKSNYFVMV